MKIKIFFIVLGLVLFFSVIIIILPINKISDIPYVIKFYLYISEYKQNIESFSKIDQEDVFIDSLKSDYIQQQSSLLSKIRIIPKHIGNKQLDNKYIRFLEYICKNEKHLQQICNSVSIISEYAEKGNTKALNFLREFSKINHSSISVNILVKLGILRCEFDQSSIDYIRDLIKSQQSCTEFSENTISYYEIFICNYFLFIVRSINYKEYITLIYYDLLFSNDLLVKYQSMKIYYDLVGEQKKIELRNELKDGLKQDNYNNIVRYLNGLLSIYNLKNEKRYSLNIDYSDLRNVMIEYKEKYDIHNFSIELFQIKPNYKEEKNYFNEDLWIE
ncbi:MAG: hypothetical protein KAT74_01730, partial [Candidatus Cloacimonetes bacterium]|nr:hypothetical protein [Candidatus Cloacimonadota bacterium]